MRYLILVLTIFSFCFAAEIKIPEYVVTSKEKIYLGDIASCKGCNPSWKRVLLAHILYPGTCIELPEGYIRARLRLGGVPLEKVKLVVPKKVKIKRTAIRLTKKDLEDIARHCIQRNNPWGKRLRILNLKAINDLLLPKGRLSYLCDLTRLPLGSFSVPIIFKVNGKIEARTWVMAKTALITPVVISSCPIRRGEIITEDKIKVIRKMMTDIPAEIFTNPKEIIGKRARINIRANRVIYRTMVEIPPLIKRGQRVKIVAESDTLRITAPGMAKEDGRLGDMIRVQNLISKKIVVGKVVDSETVKVEF